MRCSDFRLLVVLWILTSMIAIAADIPHPALVVLNKTENTLIVVDPATLKIVARAPTGAGPHEVTVSADGKLAFVGNYGAQTPGSSLSIVELATQKERKVDLGALRRPHGMVEGGGRIWFTAETNRAIARYNPGSGEIDWIMGTGQNGTHMLVLSKNQSKIFAANIGSDSVTAFEQATGPQGQTVWQITQIAVGKGPEAIDLSPDGSELWTAHSRDGGVSLIDVATKKVKATLPPLTKRSNRLKFTPDGKHVLISDLDAGDLVVLDVATRKEIKRLHLGGTPEGIQVAPDGSRAFCASTNANTVFVIDLKTLEIADKIETPSPDGMAWVP